MQTATQNNTMPQILKILDLVKKIDKTWYKSLKEISDKLHFLYSGLSFCVPYEESYSRRMEEIDALLAEFKGGTEVLLGQTRDLYRDLRRIHFSGVGISYAFLEDFKRAADDLERELKKLGKAMDEAVAQSLAPKVTYQGATLSRETTGCNFQLLHHGQGTHPEAEIVFTGLAGEDVSIEMLHEIGSGGHKHQIEPGYLGEFTSDPPGLMGPRPSVGKAAFTFPRDADEVKIIYRASDVCSRRKFRIKSNGLPEQLQFYVDVKYKVQLYNLWDEQFENLDLQQGDTTHPTEFSHYGTKEMIDALLKLDQAYGEAKAIGTLPANMPPIYVNDISLPWGGKFDIGGQLEVWKDGKLVENDHLSHKWGEDVDISYRWMSAVQRVWFKTAAGKFFKTVDTHKKGTDQEHWHLDLH